MDDNNPQDFGDVGAESGYEDGGQLDSGAPAVTAEKGKILIVLGGVVLLAMFIMSMLGDDVEEEKETEDKEVRKIVSEDAAANFAVPNMPVELPPPPMPNFNNRNSLSPPSAPGDDSALFGLAEDREALEAERRKRLRSDMMISSGSSMLSDDEEEARSSTNPADSNTAFARSVSNSSAERVKAGHIGRLSTTIGQGKVIDAVLETAIDTQLPGMVRAIVSRDTYAESGRKRLIPKGSRLVGTYNTGLFQGQNRVFIVWTRVLRPDGIDMMIDSPGADALGRAGIRGFSDNRYTEIFSGAILTSILSLAMAKAGEEIVGDDGTTQSTSSSGDTTTTATTSSAALSQGIATINQTGQQIIRQMIDTRPSITVDQGTRVNILVNKDLVFPDDNINQKFVY